MVSLYLSINGEEKGPYSEDQVRAMYLAGTLTSDVHYWQEGQVEWLPIDTLFASPIVEQSGLSAPTSPPFGDLGKEPNKKPLLVLLIIGGLFASVATGFYLFNKHQADIANQQVEMARQQRQVPLEIKQAINNLTSATSTGINKETYTTLVIALKSAVSTYGQNLPQDEAKLLAQTVDAYDIGVQLWNKAETDDDGISTILLNISSDSQLDSAVQTLGILPINDTANHPDFRRYFRSDVLSKLWSRNELAIQALLSGVDNKDAINSFNAQGSQQQQTATQPEINPQQQAHTEPKSNPASSQNLSINPETKAQLLKPKDEEQAAKAATISAQNGDSDSEDSLGVMYGEGRGVSRDFSNAINWFTKAAGQDNAKAEYHLGIMYENGWGVAKDGTQAVTWITKSANHDFALAEVRLAGMYRSGKNVTKDIPTAINLYTKAANQDNTLAEYTLGNIYQLGDGVNANAAEAKQWLQKAAAHKSRDASYALGYYYGSADGADHDYAKALQWYSESANKGKPEAQEALAILYRDGNGVTQNAATSFSWFLKAANQGLSSSELQVAAAYHKGDGVKADDTEALKWFESAATHGEKDLETLMSALALLQLVENHQNPGEIVQTKAKNGDSSAEYSMGLMCESGAGVAKDDNIAVDWFQKAAAQGNDDAKDKLLIRKFKNGGPLTASEWTTVLKHHTSKLSLYEAIGGSDDQFEDDSRSVYLFFNRAASEDGTQANDLYVTMDLLNTNDGGFQVGPVAFRIKGQPTVLLY